MEWKNLRLNTCQNVQGFTEDFRKKALELNILVDFPETIMKYIGALPNYIHHTLLLLNPTNLDEASVQSIYIECRVKHAQDGDPSKHGEDCFKGKGKDKKTTTQTRTRRKCSIELIVKGWA